MPGIHSGQWGVQWLCKSCMLRLIINRCLIVVHYCCIFLANCCSHMFIGSFWLNFRSRTWFWYLLYVIKNHHVYYPFIWQVCMSSYDHMWYAFYNIGFLLLLLLLQFCSYQNWKWIRYKLRFALFTYKLCSRWQWKVQVYRTN